MSSDPVSVVATVKNERNSIERLLGALLAQTEPPAEIVISDGGSGDGTPERIERLAHKATVPVRLLRDVEGNISTGRNAAIREAHGPLIAVTDAGAVPDADWLERLVEPLRADPGVGVSSGFFRPGGSGLLERTIAVVITPQLPEISPGDFLPSSRSVAFRKTWWSQVGGYPEWLDHCEDLVFDISLRDAGAGFAFAPDAVVEWDARPSLRAFAKQYFLYARGDAHAGLWPARHAARYSAYAAGASLLTLAIGLASPWPLVVLGALAGVYLARFFRRVLRVRPARGARLTAALALVPVIVITGDLAKMAGYLAGRLRGPPRGG